MRFWRNTSVASLAAGQTATLPVGTLGYEWDADLDNGAPPAGSVRLSTTTLTHRAARCSGLRLDLRQRHRHALPDAVPRTERRAGVRRRHDPVVVGPRRDPRSRQRGGGPADAAGDRQPVRRHGRAAGHPAVRASSRPRASTDTTPPTSTITSPTAGSTLAVGTPVTITGTRERRRRRGRRRRGLGRRRHDLAPGGRAQQLELRLDAAVERHVHDPDARRRRQRQPGSAGRGHYRHGRRAVPDTTAPTVSAVSPANNATGVARTVSPIVTFSEAINPSTINSTTFELRNASTNALVFATVTYDAATRRATLNPSGNLAAGTRFTATVRGGATDPRVKDLAGNPLAASVTWSFTTR